MFATTRELIIGIMVPVSAVVAIFCTCLWVHRRLNRVRESYQQLLSEQSKNIEKERIEHAATVEEQVRRRLEAAGELDKIREEVQAAGRAKMELIANVSHEFRTPLSAVLGFASILANSSNLTEKQRDFAGRIVRNGEHLVRVVDDLLDIAKIERGLFEIMREPTPWRAVLDEALQLNQELIAAKQLSFQLTQEDRVPAIIETDPCRLKQIFVNLLSNAAKYSDDGGIHVMVGLTKSDAPCQYESIFVDIRDSGRGISSDQFHQIFTPFYRVQDHALPSSGSGLGLALSKKLASSLGGDLLLLHSEPGQGSCFRLFLPLKV